MSALDILSLTLSFLGFYGLIFSLRYVIPCFFIPFLSAHLSATQFLLDQAEAINAIPLSDYRTLLDTSATQFAAMRLESNRARGPCQQLRLIIHGGLTCRLLLLYHRIEGLRSKLELAIDEQQLRIAETQCICRRAVPANNLADPAPPSLPAPAPLPAPPPPAPDLP